MRLEKANIEGRFPRQKLSYRKKTQKWAAQCVAYGADKNMFTSEALRQDAWHKKVNYDLVNGKIHMDDIAAVVSPSGFNYEIPDEIQHYPIINSPMQVLIGESLSRPFDYKVIVTNPDGISEIEEKKINAARQSLQEIIAENSQNEDEYNQKVEQMAKEFYLNWQDSNEKVANQMLEQDVKDSNYKLMFTKGFIDGCVVGEELYQSYISSGNPKLRKLHPISLHAYGMGQSSNFDDADMIVIEEYWNKGLVIDQYHEFLTSEDITRIEEYEYSQDTSELGGLFSSGEPSYVEQPTVYDGSTWNEMEGISPSDLFVNTDESVLPYDLDGNIRVTQVFWKSLRKIKKIKSYNPITGETEYSLHTEDYIPNKERGEEEVIWWVNEAWHGTRIGEDIYVDMGPCAIQYNDIDNPSKCSFGIVGSLYNIGNDKPFSLVDMMKTYSYLYDATMNKLNALLARNRGKAVVLDFASKPNEYSVEQWMDLLTNAGLYVKDSFKEGDKGAATGKLAGGLNNANNGSVDLDLSNSINNYIVILNYIETAMGKVTGITEQRKGQIANRETVGGVERSVLQSSHITEWWFAIHDDVIKRALEMHVNTGRACLKGKSKKFQYTVSSNLAQQIVSVDGDSYCMNSYGLVVDNQQASNEFNKNLPMIIQAALQNQSITLSALMQLYNSTSRAEKQSVIEQGENEMFQRRQQEQQQALESQQRIAEMERQTALEKMEHESALNTENNETKILIAQIEAQARALREQPTESTMSEGEVANLNEKKREFDKTHALAEKRLEFDKDKAKKDAELKSRQANKQRTTTAK